jgi:arsenite-transporting ATPase
LRQLLGETTVQPTADEDEPVTLRAPSLSELVDDVAADGHGLVMLMGKGGVGKTTLAAAVAVELARRGLPVHLTTSDPAAHLAETLHGSMSNLTVSRIDPHAETERYRREVLAAKGAKLDAQGRALLEEDLRSPCTEEIAVFSRPFRGSFAKRDKSSWLWTLRRRATPCFCSMRRAPITEKSRGRSGRELISRRR